MDAGKKPKMHTPAERGDKASPLKKTCCGESRFTRDGGSRMSGEKSRAQATRQIKEVLK